MRAPSRMWWTPFIESTWPRHVLNGIVGILAICYPFLVYLSKDSVQPRYLAFFLAAVLLLRGACDKRNRVVWHWAVLASASVLFMLAAGWANKPGLLLAYPVFVSLMFFGVFSYSLAYPPTVVERLARMQDPGLPPQGVVYTGKVTRVWCGFFLVNASASLATVWHGDPWLWSLYNGFVSYLLMAVLMLGEMLVRKRIRNGF